MTKNQVFKSGFTIVELLVVIVVIGILAAISLVSYAGINQRAIGARIASDLSNNSKLLELYKVEHDEYPATIDDGTGGTNCPVTPEPDDKYCLITSGDDDILTYEGDGGTGGGAGDTYTVTITDEGSDIAYEITPGGDPVAVDNGGEESSGPWSSIASGLYHTCAIGSDNKAYCWGRNNDGQLGDGNGYSDSYSINPVAVVADGALSGKTIESIVTGGYSSCAIASDNKAYCWGFANEVINSSTVPVAVDTSGALNGKTIKSISVGGYVSACVVASDSKAYCWGYNSDGQLGNGTEDDALSPVAVDTSGVLSGKTIKSISVSEFNTCAIASDDKVYCWGYGGDGELGNGSEDDSSSPVAVDMSGVLSGKTAKSISTSQFHSCLIASDDKAYCWGANSSGELGDGGLSGDYSTTPVAVNDSGVLAGKAVRSITAAADGFTCAIASDNKPYCWGSNSEGRLGDDTVINRNVPVAVYLSGVLNGKVVTQISSGAHHTCVMDSLKDVYCWGNNNHAELSMDPITLQSIVPVFVSNLP